MGDDLQHPSRFAAEAPDRPAVVMGDTGEVLTYGQLEERSCRVAHLLRSVGCGTGAHVAVLLENRRIVIHMVCDEETGSTTGSGYLRSAGLIDRSAIAMLTAGGLMLVGSAALRSHTTSP